MRPRSISHSKLEVNVINEFRALLKKNFVVRNWQCLQINVQVPSLYTREVQFKWNANLMWQQVYLTVNFKTQTQMLNYIQPAQKYKHMLAFEDLYNNYLHSIKPYNTKK